MLPAIGDEAWTTVPTRSESRSRTLKFKRGLSNATSIGSHPNCEIGLAATGLSVAGACPSAASIASSALFPMGYRCTRKSVK